MGNCIIKGVDVSSYQGRINWNLVRGSGVQFAILKIIRKDLNPDTQFENNWKGCNDAGIPVDGVYNYSYATTVEKAKNDAQKVVSILNGRRATVWLDAEDNCQKNLGHKLVDIIKAYEQVITTAGLPFGVYTGKDFYKTYLAKYAAELPYDFWLARYPSKSTMGVLSLPNESYNPKSVLVSPSKFYGWQYTSNGSVSGISGAVDINAVYSTVEETPAPAAPTQTQNTSGQHIQPNYQAGQAYFVRVNNLRIRKTPNGAIIGSISNRAVGNKATTRDSKGWIWMNISGTNTPEWVCADNGEYSFVI